MANRVFGKPNPNDGDWPTEGMLASVEFAIDGISYFMPNKLMKWDVVNNSGNPTKTIIVNELMRRVKRKIWGNLEII